VDDDLQPESFQRMHECLHATLAAIHATRMRGGHVFVHCHAGRQRSACVVAAYLILYCNMSKDSAIQFIKSKRRVAFIPGINFEPVLDRI
jgi:protein-tyrosine phosphatase